MTAGKLFSRSDFEVDKLIEGPEDGNVSLESPPQVLKVVQYTLTSIIVIILLSICIRLIYKDNLLKSGIDAVMMASLYYMMILICGFIIRTCNFLSEIQFAKTHYENGITSVLKATFEINGQSIFLMVFSVIVLSAYCAKEGNPVTQAWAHGPLSSCLAYALAYILSDAVNLNESNYMTIRTIRLMAGVDYGGGMAFSYFYGYLRIILPGLRKKMEIYEAAQDVTIPVKKMFILIPESGHIPPDLCDASYQWLEATTNLEHIVIDRAGVKRRNYKNTVYKIHPNSQAMGHRPVYVITEGATPMMTFWEILIHDHEQTATYKQNRMQIVASFYKTLQQLIDNDPECRDVCELVYYKDYEKGKKINVAEILLGRIQAQAAMF
ncbi:stimulator of interferon genes protein [Fopius arisanus]|uniref:Stimulator of interferon genes protein n=2 Tax=Fopius arisanus TaxID=64838 RepID=A0A9R1UB63_9HYME|nr:PREDICTED: stimulator of interferon genes protein [Fopius arisanus]